MKDNRVQQYGEDILRSEEFGKALTQVHHYTTSVGEHSIETACMGLIVSDFFNRKGANIDEYKVVRICLLHDIGMIGRDERYENNYRCWLEHPVNSALEAGNIWQDIDEMSRDAIKGHMWPLSKHMPHSKEGFVLCLADKMASICGLLQVKHHRSSQYTS